MITDITDFLPIYTDIDNDDFYMDIFRKKEFYDVKVPETEVIKKTGELLKSQIIITRFLSSFTPYNSLLLNFAVGIGKTCAAVSSIEKYRQDSDNFSGALILARGEPLLDNFKNEILNCTAGKYIPENYINLSPQKQVTRKNKILSNAKYEFKTFEKFATDIEKLSDDYLITKYSNKIIVIDEVHNIRLHKETKIVTPKKKSKKEGKQKHTSQINIYNNFYHFLHIIKNCKILLMTGTPITDTIDEIASIMNLILPIDEKLPTGKKFIKEFFDYNKQIYTIKPAKVPELKKVFKGRVSYLQAMKSDIKLDFVGETIGTLQHLKVYPGIMSDFQTAGYKDAYIKDHKKVTLTEDAEAVEEEENIVTEIEDEYVDDDITKISNAFIFQLDGNGIKEDYSFGRFDTKSRQAALFVFPNGTYGKEGFDNPKYIKQSTKEDAYKDSSLILNNFTMTRELKDKLAGRDNSTKLNKLQKYSTKYAEVIKKLLKAYEDGKSSFVYCEWIKGSGAILFSLILESYGYTRYTGNELSSRPLDEKKRYAIINNITTYPNEIKNILNRFNNPKNMNGKFISVIIGSKIIAEGITLKNVQEEHILTPHWNYSVTEQVIARGYRFNSHRDLVNANIIPEVKIYQYVSIPNDNTQSVDLKLYELSEIKDISIKSIIQVIKESAFDCALNFKRNYITGYDYKRECNYTKCEYTCDGVPEIYYKEDIIPPLDYSSYQVYYNKDKILELVEKIRNIFKTVFNIKLTDLIDILKNETIFDILTTIRAIIYENIFIINKYGIKSFLREQNNVVFLVDSILDQNDYFLNYYNKNPIINLDKPFIYILREIYKKELPVLTDTLFNSTNTREIIDLLDSFTLEFKEILLESCLISKEKGYTLSDFQREKILEYFENNYEKIGTSWVSSLLYYEKNILRCFNTEDINNVDISNLWSNCSDDIVNIFAEGKQTKINVFKQNEYFGKYNAKNFCIVKSNFTDDKRRENTGKVCESWDKPILVYMASNILKLPLHIIDNFKWKTVVDECNKIKNSKDILIKKKLINTKYVKICTYNEEEAPPIWETRDYTYDELNIFSYDELKTMFYFTKLTKKQICELIKEWFDKQTPSLLLYDEACGQR